MLVNLGMSLICLDESCIRISVPWEFNLLCSGVHNDGPNCWKMHAKVPSWEPKHALKCPHGWQNTLNCPLGWLKHDKLPSWVAKTCTKVPSWGQNAHQIALKNSVYATASMYKFSISLRCHGERTSNYGPEEAELPSSNQNRKRHSFSSSLSPRNVGTTGITVDRPHWWKRQRQWGGIVIENEVNQE